MLEKSFNFDFLENSIITEFIYQQQLIFASLQRSTGLPNQCIKRIIGLKEKYPCIHVDTLKSIRIKDILTENRIFLLDASVLGYE